MANFNPHANVDEWCWCCMEPAPCKDALRALVNRLTRAVVGCIDSLEYVDQNFQNVGGSGVRHERVKAAKVLIDEVHAQMGRL